MICLSLNYSTPFLIVDLVVKISVNQTIHFTNSHECKMFTISENVLSSKCQSVSRFLFINNCSWAESRYFLQVANIAAESRGRRYLKMCPINSFCNFSNSLDGFGICSILLCKFDFVEGNFPTTKAFRYQK